MNKIYQLDPRHKNLLNDHSSGYWWLRPTNNHDKYKGSILFIEDFGSNLAKGLQKKITVRRLHSQLIKYNTHGYIFSGLDFIKLLPCKSGSLERLAKAQEIKRLVVQDMKLTSHRAATQKAMINRHGPEYAQPKRVPWNRAEAKERQVWIWSFKNDELQKSFEHIFHFIDEGQVIGKPRALFCSVYNLRYSTMQLVASGKIKAHRGWTLIEEPKRVTHRQAIAMKIKLLE